MYKIRYIKSNLSCYLYIFFGRVELVLVVTRTKNTIGLEGQSIDMNVPLPQLREYVKRHLKENESVMVWSKMIEESARYYLGLFPHIGQSAEYRSMGHKFYQTYPTIKQEGNEPWCSHLRWSEKRKSSGGETALKKQRSFTVAMDHCSNAIVINSDDYERNVSELSKEWTKPQHNENHIKMLLKETHKGRLMWLSTVPVGT